MSGWLPTACMLCECNCGIEVRLGGEDGRHITRVRGNRAHPTSRGYTCQKATRIDHYQNGRDRVTQPLRRRSDGRFEPIDWDTAIREVAERLGRVRDQHGGPSIFYYGGGGQGNHLPGGYAAATRRALGIVHASNALAQEKTGEFWVMGRLFGAPQRPDYERCEVAVFVGKNPWQSHGVPRARATLREIAKDPSRCLIVVDPRRSETAELADIHLRPRPGTDAWLLLAMLGVLVQEDWIAKDWLATHTSGLDLVLPVLREQSVAACAAACGVAEPEIRRAVERIARAERVAMGEDLGVQMNRHSTLVSYLEKLVWLLTGNFAREGTAHIPAMLLPILGDGAIRGHSPVTGAPLISGLLPCNVIPDEILTDHPDRFRAILVESTNPVHSLADSQRMREALRALDTVVVIDVALTETAREAHYVLPAATQYEKWEASFFNFEFPENHFHLRKPVLDAPSGVLPEPEIHARLVEALGAAPDAAISELRQALADGGRKGFREAFFRLTQAEPGLMAWLPLLLYRSLGPALPEGAASAAVLWATAQLFATREPDSARRAGHGAAGGEDLGDALFDAILAGHDGIVFAKDTPEDCWRRLATPDGRIQLAIPELLEQIAALGERPEAITSPEFPFVLSAGERRDYTANTIFRDPHWRKKDAEGALRIHPDDAAAIGLEPGRPARITSARGSATTAVEISDRMLPGHVSLPNGLGVDNLDGERLERTGVALNELTASGHRDDFAGTPWHKHVPVRIEPA